MTSPIGYYVHHHGDGHRQRALLIARHAPERFVLLGTGLRGRTDGLACIDLPDDRIVASRLFDGDDGSVGRRPQSLHYAPYYHDGVRQRCTQIAGWIAEARPEMIVVDVSVEVAMLARLCATPTVYVRLAGLRTDPAHNDAFRGAQAIIAPFHKELDDPSMTDWVRDRTVYFAGLASADPAQKPMDDTVLVIRGRGGGTQDPTPLISAARATPSYRWRVAGPFSPPDDLPGNLTFLGWTDNVAAEMALASVVVGSAGDGTVNTVIAAGKPFICMPEERPFEEQIRKARRLAEIGAAIVLHGWPQTALWPELLQAACALPAHNITQLQNPFGAADAARYLTSLATAEEI